MVNFRCRQLRPGECLWVGTRQICVQWEVKPPIESFPQNNNHSQPDLTISIFTFPFVLLGQSYKLYTRFTTPDQTLRIDIRIPKTPIARILPPRDSSASISAAIMANTMEDAQSNTQVPDTTDHSHTEVPKANSEPTQSAPGGEDRGTLIDDARHGRPTLVAKIGDFDCGKVVENEKCTEPDTRTEPVNKVQSNEKTHHKNKREPGQQTQSVKKAHKSKKAQLAKLESVHGNDNIKDTESERSNEEQKKEHTQTTEQLPRIRRYSSADPLISKRPTHTAHRQSLSEATTLTGSPASKAFRHERNGCGIQNEVHSPSQHEIQVQPTGLLGPAMPYGPAGPHCKLTSACPNCPNPWHLLDLYPGHSLPPGISDLLPPRPPILMRHFRTEGNEGHHLKEQVIPMHGSEKPLPSNSRATATENSCPPPITPQKQCVSGFPPSRRSSERIQETQIQQNGSFGHSSRSASQQHDAAAADKRNVGTQTRATEIASLKSTSCPFAGPKVPKRLSWPSQQTRANMARELVSLNENIENFNNAITTLKNYLLDVDSRLLYMSKTLEEKIEALEHVRRCFDGSASDARALDVEYENLVFVVRTRTLTLEKLNEDARNLCDLTRQYHKTVMGQLGRPPATDAPRTRSCGATSPQE